MDSNLKLFRILLLRSLYYTKGKATFNNLHELEKNQWLPNEEIKRIQWIKHKILLNYIYNKVPYYKNIFNNLKLTPNDIKTPKDFRKLPILTKEDIKKNISEITSVEYNEKDLYKNSTGGSTGRNLQFYVGRKNSGFREGVAIRGNRWAGLDIGVKHAYLWGNPFDISIQNKIINRIYNKIIGCGLFLSSYDLSEKNMALYVKKLLQYKPDVIIGYSSPLFLFAKYIEEKKFEKINIKSIISSAEVLYDHQRQTIESIFDCKVFNRYGCREFGGIAHECSEHSGLHINSDHVYVECLNKNGEPTSPGEKGELIITDLDNYGMPFIRYRIGDIGIISDEKCKCGRGLPQLENVEGRTFDIIVGTNGRSLGGTFWTLLFRTAFNGVQQFQVVQETKRKLNIKIVVDGLFNPKDIDILTNKIHEYCGVDMQINIKIVDKIPLTKSGKLRFIISNVNPFVN